MELDAIRIFAKVAELASFTRAAEQLGLTRARVSGAVQQLEAEFGTRLLHRTTRRVHLTPDGEQCHERCRELLGQADELQAMFERTPAALRGRLRIDLPNRLARMFLIPRLPEFLAAHPSIEVELSTTDRRVDLVQDGFDFVLRVGTLVDSGSIGRRLGVLNQTNCASPAYLREYGVPRNLADLARHRLVHYTPTLGMAPPGWEYTEAGKVKHQPMAGVVTVNSSDAFEAACLAGLGITQVPALGIQPLLAQGSLVEVLPDFVAPPMPVTLLYPNRRHVARRVQAAMNWVAAVLVPLLDPPS